MVQHLLTVTYERPEKREGLCTSRRSWFPSDLFLCPGLEELLSLSASELCALLCPHSASAEWWGGLAPEAESWCLLPSPRRWIVLHCTQWGKLLSPASVIAVNPLIYLHSKLAFLQLVGLILNMASFSFLKINHNFKKLWILANKIAGDYLLQSLPWLVLSLLLILTVFLSRDKKDFLNLVTFWKIK